MAVQVVVVVLYSTTKGGATTYSSYKSPALTTSGTNAATDAC